MDASLPTRVVRIARQLSVTPVELVEPVLAGLPLYRVLDLLSTQYGIRSDTSGGDVDGGGALETAIANSPAWSILAGLDLRRLKELWVAYNQLASLSKRKRALEVYFASSESYTKCSNLSPRLAHIDLIKTMANDLNDSFIRSILVKERFWHKHTTLRDLCAYLAVGEDLSPFWSPVDPEGPRSKQYESRSAVTQDMWTVDDSIRVLPRLHEALRDLNHARSEELRRLASLYELFPTYLRTPLAPPTPRQNPGHIPQLFRRIARKPTHLRACFGWAHPALVPYDWCFGLFDAVLQMPEMSEMTKAAETGNNSDFQAHLQKARDGLDIIYSSELPRTSVEDGIKRQKLHDLVYQYLPSPVEELEWLESFMRCVEWMETQFPELALELKAASVKRWFSDGPKDRELLEEADFQNLIEGPNYDCTVVRQLKADLKAAKKGTGKLPSLMALYLPPFSSPRARKIASRMWPKADLRSGVRQMMYEEMVKTIKARLSQPHDVDFQDGQGEEIQPYQPTKDSRDRPRTCYVCHSNLDQPHKTFGSMCVPCGDFNLAERALSHPANLWLAGQTALVTGGRINLGFHTALRLLRCGAFVIVSSRYPEDALSRYQKEPDFDTWADRLRVVGADFRAARDAFALVEAAKAILQKEQRSLDILINNAAQTLTDPVGKEQRAIDREQLLLNQSKAAEDATGKSNPVVVRQGYSARVRGGATGMISGQDTTGLIAGTTHASTDADSLAAQTSNLQLSGPSTPSSWVQSLSNIPYEDVISAHSVNTFVPLILVRELMPLMGRGGHIINVSSREGIFESQRDSAAKGGKHVHTNMSKAGLNMITETEAATAWKQRKVAINTVDPGYMSAAPEFELAYGGERPIGWEDGTGRVLWPIAQHKRGTPIWGRFLKHYGAVRIDTRLGRG